MITHVKEVMKMLVIPVFQKVHLNWNFLLVEMTCTLHSHPLLELEDSTQSQQTTHGLEKGI